jgi:hypothetical protein
VNVSVTRIRNCPSCGSRAAGGRNGKGELDFMSAAGMVSAGFKSFEDRKTLIEYLKEHH